MPRFLSTVNSASAGPLVASGQQQPGSDPQFSRRGSDQTGQVTTGAREEAILAVNHPASLPPGHHQHGLPRSRPEGVRVRGGRPRAWSGDLLRRPQAADSPRPGWQTDREILEDVNLANMGKLVETPSRPGATRPETGRFLVKVLATLPRHPVECTTDGGVSDPRVVHVLAP
jgi:hypothetical protein